VTAPCSAAALAPFVLLAPRLGAQDSAETTARAGVPEIGYDGGFFLRSADGAAELRVGGLFQTVFGVFDDERDPSFDADLKRMRPELSGRIAALEFQLEPKFTEDDVELEEAWIGTRLGARDTLLMLGRMKGPFGLEEVRSRRHIDFPRFSIVNQLSPAEDHGLFLNGSGAAGVFEYGLAAYDGSGASDTTSSRDLAARVMVHPFAASDTPARELGLGIAATVGRQDEDVGGSALENEAGLPVVEFAPDTALDGERRRAGLEAQWFQGPWFAQGELVLVEQEMSSAAGAADVDLRGGYLTLARVLTGEAKTFKGVVPDEPFAFDTLAGRGAFVLALRLSELRLDDALGAPGWTEPGTFTDRIRTYSLGLNWIPNRHAILRNALVLTHYADEVELDEGATDREAALLVEFQLHF
jgi:phosphate-selective porin OprO/OprP